MYNSALSQSLRRITALVLLLSALLSQDVAATRRVIESTSLNTCMSNSQFSATLFNVTFTPDNGALIIKINGYSSISGNVTALLKVIAYGYTAMEKALDPCTMKGFEGMCPMSTGQITLNSQIDVDGGVASQIPGKCLSETPRDGD